MVIKQSLRQMIILPKHYNRNENGALDYKLKYRQMR
jgi:hypothetical protein